MKRTVGIHLNVMRDGSLPEHSSRNNGFLKLEYIIREVKLESSQFFSRKRWVSKKYPIIITNVTECLLDMRHDGVGLLYRLFHLILKNNLIKVDTISPILQKRKLDLKVFEVTKL